MIRISDAIFSLISLVAMIALWKVGSLILTERFFPSPEGTLLGLIELMRDPSTWLHVRMTMMRVVLGFILAMALGVLVGTLMGLFRKGERLLEIPVVVGLTIPSLCYIIVTFMLFGMNDYASITAVALTTFPSIAVNVWSGVKAIDNNLINMAKVFGHGPSSRTMNVVLPQVLPYIVAAARFGFGLVWKIVVVVELLGLSNGVGYQLNYYFQLFDMRNVFAWTMIFTMIMVLVEFLLLRPLEKRVFRWRPEVSS